MSCYCRGGGTCPNCEGHLCTGACTCDTDPTPNTQADVTTGWAPPEDHAWQEKLELTR